MRYDIVAFVLLLVSLFATIMVVVYYVGRLKSLQAELERARKELGESVREMYEYRVLALVDGLTQVPNRRGFDTFVDKVFAQHEREKSDTPITLSIVDMDDFKLANDDIGHQFGDEILRTFGEILRRSVRTADVIGRLGGDEFAVLFVGADAKEASDVLDRVRREYEVQVGDLYAIHDGAKPDTLSLSYGLATWSGEHRLELFKEADLDMYRNKRRRKAEHASQ